MSIKKIAAIIIASLVAGVVLGSFGIAGAGSNQTKLPGAMAPVPASMADNCGDCSVEAAAASECGDGACSTSATAPAAAPNADAAPMAGCPGNGAAAAGDCGSGDCAQ